MRDAVKAGMVGVLLGAAAWGVLTFTAWSLLPDVPEPVEAELREAPVECVRFVEASDDLLRFASRLARTSLLAARATQHENATRLARIIGRMDALEVDLANLSPRYEEQRKGCLAWTG